MARVQLIIPDEDRDRFAYQARTEGTSFSAWMRAAARQRLEERQRIALFESPAQLDEFFRECDALEGPDREPEWEQHMKVMEESRRRGQGAS